MSKEEREAAINQKIEEMRRKNASITQRYQVSVIDQIYIFRPYQSMHFVRHTQEIENDKKNAENFSLEATQRTKTRVTPENEDKTCCRTVTAETSPKETNANARAAKELRRIKQATLPSVPVTTDFRPQRLSEVWKINPSQLINDTKNNAAIGQIMIFDFKLLNRTICLHPIQFFPTWPIGYGREPFVHLLVQQRVASIAHLLRVAKWALAVATILGGPQRHPTHLGRVIARQSTAVLQITNHLENIRQWVYSATIDSNRLMPVLNRVISSLWTVKSAW